MLWKQALELYISLKLLLLFSLARSIDVFACARSKILDSFTIQHLRPCPTVRYLFLASNMLPRSLLTSCLDASVLAGALPKRGNSVWNVDNFDSLVTFGDSYTDEGRLGYIIQQNFTLPPVGTYLPEGLNTASGGRTWPRFAVQYTNEQLELYDYAVSGAVCSNNITPR